MRNKARSYSFSDRNKKYISGSFRAPQNKKNHSFTWFIILFFIFIIFFIYLVFSGFFSIKEIKINGLVKIDQMKVEEIVQTQKNNNFLFFHQSNLLFFNKKKLINNLNNYNFSQVLVKKRIFKKTLVLNIKEREQAFIFLENNNYFFSDKNGAIINYLPSCFIPEKNTSSVEINLNAISDEKENEEQKNQTLEIIDLNSADNPNSIDSAKIQIDHQNINKANENNKTECLIIDETYKKDNLYPIIENIAKIRVGEDKKQIKLDPEYIDFALKLYNDLTDNSEFGLNRIILDEEYNTVKIKLNNGLDVYFSFKSDYLEQLSRFFAIKKEKSEELRGKKYIDLRYGDKIFYY